MAGGCCGTTPDTIRTAAAKLKGIAPRKPTSASPFLRLSGLEVLTFTPDLNFVNLGERCNVTGSRMFANLIKANKFDVTLRLPALLLAQSLMALNRCSVFSVSLQKALEVAKLQIENGAQVLDINFDEAMLDSEASMSRFLRLIASEPGILIRFCFVCFCCCVDQ